MNRRQLAAIEDLRTESRVLREQLGPKRRRFTDAQHRLLAERAKALGRAGLAAVASIATPDTILRWYRDLIAAKYDGAKARGPGRSAKHGDLLEIVLRMARENPRWGYTRIVGAMKNLGHDLARNTVKRILVAHGIAPAPLRGKQMSWRTFSLVSSAPGSEREAASRARDPCRGVFFVVCRRTAEHSHASSSKLPLAGSRRSRRYARTTLRRGAPSHPVR